MIQPRVRQVLVVAPGARVDFSLQCNLSVNISKAEEVILSSGPKLTENLKGKKSHKIADALKHVMKYMDETFVIEAPLLNLQMTKEKSPKVEKMKEIKKYDYIYPEGLSDFQKWNKKNVISRSVSMDAGILDKHGNKLYGINGIPFNGKPNFNINLDDAQEWIIYNNHPESHPFHMHTNKFQIIKVQPSDHEIADMLGDFRDTIILPAPGNVTIRFRPVDFTGISALHCHILKHSDSGMLMSFEIV